MSEETSDIVREVREAAGTHGAQANGRIWSSTGRRTPCVEHVIRVPSVFPVPLDVLRKDRVKPETRVLEVDVQLRIPVVGRSSGERLRAYRQQCTMTKPQLPQFLGLESPSHIADFEGGQCCPRSRSSSIRSSCCGGQPMTFLAKN
jgi:hypothetical protein